MTANNQFRSHGLSIHHEAQNRLQPIKSRRVWLRNSVVSTVAVASCTFSNSLTLCTNSVLADEKSLAAVELAKPRLLRENLLVYRAANNEPTAVKSPSDWQHRRAEIVRGMETVMGRLPGNEKRIPFEMSVDEEVDCGNYIRRLISFASEPNCRVPAYLCIPKAVLQEGKKAPAVLCLHGTDNVIGHGVVVGLGRENRQYASELAERGYVTIAPNYPLLAKYQPDLEVLG